MGKISAVVVAAAVFVMVVAMITAAGVFNSGYVLAKSKDSGSSGSSDSNSGGGSSNGGSGDNNGNGDSGSKTEEAKPTKAINNPLNPGKEDTKDISDNPAENCVGKKCAHDINQEPKCMIPEGCGPGQHPAPAPDPKAPVTIIKQRIDIDIIVKNIIHRGGGGGSGSSSHGLSSACFDAIKIAWLGKIHRGQNHEVDNFIDKCLNV